MTEHRDSQPPGTTEPREHLVRALEADLVGPFRRGLGGPENGLDSREALELPPSRWYLCGFLAPEEGREEEEDSTEELGAGNDETEEETQGAEAEPKRKNFLPASFGLSVIVPPGCRQLRARVRYANYDKPEKDDPERRLLAKYWYRVPMPATLELIDLDAGDLEEDGVSVANAGGLRIVGQVQALNGVRGVPAGSRAVSVFLVNRRAPDIRPGYRDRAYVFQVEFELECEAGFLPRPDFSGEGSADWDEQVADLQYREHCEFAVGHGVSVEVPAHERAAARESGKVHRVCTSWVPRFEVRPVEAREEAGVTVGMEELAALETPEQVKQHLSRLPAAYRQWINEQAKIDQDQSTQRGEVQKQLVQRAEQACARIEAGIRLLCESARAREAFCIANQAMADAARKRSPKRYATSVPEWRLFQLAFLLLNLPGLSAPGHPDREKVELIFFPTGGGKTEAYLGVIAYLLALRRLTALGEAHAGLGVAVILRYTLRLLTLDQLGRAATLICALESRRRKTPARLGDQRFSVGLWVGRSATANTMEEVAKQVLSYKSGTGGGNPCPLTNCPWCRTELGPSSLTLLSNGKSSNKSPDAVLVACTNHECEFSAANHAEGIPLVFVDDQVYRELPSFLIGTVDKFAMLPWRGEAGKLFGRVTARDHQVFFSTADGNSPKGAKLLPKGLLPPDLIVQDELHLISGPLGTMVGLYETAVDFLSTRPLPSAPRNDGDGLPPGALVRPKVIAATATVRRAQQQIQALYGRSAHDICVFPPPAVDALETYFSLVNRKPEVPGRLYVGVAAQGRSIKAILLRVYRALIAAAAHAYDPHGHPKQSADAYMTLVGYFNSLRELGGMRRIAEDELRVRCAKAEEFQPVHHEGPHPWFKNRQLNAEPVELTSRLKTPGLKRAKDRLDQPYAEKEHVDVILASNMISVGVDIERLGLMVVAGQPKTTAEYIQASSRVGRQERWPGLVVTCMNVHKPRDRSHYERFTAYHESFYRRVEASSVTPFSGPALERGLAGTLVAMSRFAHSGLTPPTGARDIARFPDVVREVVSAVGRRAAVQPEKSRKLEDELVQQVEALSANLFETWKLLVKSTDEEPSKRQYSKFDKNRTAGVPLLHTPLDPNGPKDYTPEARFRAPTSMRDVEEAAHLWIAGRQLGPYQGKKAEG